MIDPETARQAAERWNDVREYLDERSQRDRAIGERGDALAVLVPQLLDQLAERYDAIGEAGAEIDSLEAERNRLRERDALGERCRQLEAENRELREAAADNLQFGLESVIERDAARAALGDTPPRGPTIDEPGEGWAAGTFEPPQPETPSDYFEHDIGYRLGGPETEGT